MVGKNCYHRFGSELFLSSLFITMVRFNENKNAHHFNLVIYFYSKEKGQMYSKFNTQLDK